MTSMVFAIKVKDRALHYSPAKWRLDVGSEISPSVHLSRATPAVVTILMPDDSSVVAYAE